VSIFGILDSEQIHEHLISEFRKYYAVKGKKYSNLLKAAFIKQIKFIRNDAIFRLYGILFNDIFNGVWQKLERIRVFSIST